MMLATLATQAILVTRDDFIQEISGLATLATLVTLATQATQATLVIRRSADPVFI